MGWGLPSRLAPGEIKVTPPIRNDQLITDPIWPPASHRTSLITQSLLWPPSVAHKLITSLSPVHPRCCCFDEGAEPFDPPDAYYDHETYCMAL